MEEGLKAVRLLHNVILAASAAIIAFASSPNDLSRLQRLSGALTQVRTTLVDYDRQAFDGYVEGLIEKETSFKQQLQVTLDSLGIATASGLRASPIIPVRTHADFATARDGRSPTLFDIAAALRRSPPIEIFKPDDLRGELLLWLAPFAQTTATLHNVRSGGMNLAGRPTIEGYLELRLSRASFLQQASTIRERITTLPIAPRIVETIDPVQITIDARIHGDFVTLKDATFAGWVARQGTPETQGTASVVIDRAAGSASLAPPLVAGLEQIGTLSLDDAQQKLDRQQEEARERQHVSLLGVEVPAALALLAAPLTLLILLTYLLSHIRHVRHIGHVRPELPPAGASVAAAGDPILRTFPWIGLFDDAQSRAFTIASIVALPLLANVWLLARLSQSWSWIWLLALVLSFAATVQSVIVIRDVTRLRSDSPAE